MPHCWSFCSSLEVSGPQVIRYGGLDFTDLFKGFGLLMVPALIITLWLRVGFSRQLAELGIQRKIKQKL